MSPSVVSRAGIRREAAHLGPRLGAAATDAGIVALLAIVAGLCARLAIILMPDWAAPAEPVVLLALTALIAGSYFVYAWGCEGATLGQRMLGLRVMRAGSPAVGERLGVRKALLRLLGLVLGGFVIDVAVAAKRSDRRALHDLLADSIVVSDSEVAAAGRVDRPLHPIRKGRKYA